MSDTVATRLHFLTFIVGDLSDTYTDIGIRRWFDRSRKELDDHTPALLLAPVGYLIRKVRAAFTNSPTLSCHPVHRHPFY